MTPTEAALHGEVADLAASLGRARRVARAQARLLDDAAHAIAHGRLDVAAEFVDRAATALRAV